MAPYVAFWHIHWRFYRVLNLFSRDTYVVDQILPRVIQGLCRTVAVCLFIVLVIGASFPPFLLALFPLGWFYLRVMKWGILPFDILMATYIYRYYLATSRELKRIDAVTRSPIFAWFSESLAGLSTIRAFHHQPIFVSIIQRRIDHNQICYLPSISVNRWLAVRLEFVGAMIILTVASLAMSALITTGVDAGLVGLVLSYALNTTSSLVRKMLSFLPSVIDILLRIGLSVLQARSSRILLVLNVSSTKQKLLQRLRQKFRRPNLLVLGPQRGLLNSSKFS